MMIIELWPHMTECIVCGDEIPLSGGQSLAMYEGEIVSDDAAKWAGFPCCAPCYQINEGRVGRPLLRESTER